MSLIQKTKEGNMEIHMIKTELKGLHRDYWIADIADPSDSLYSNNISDLAQGKYRVDRDISYIKRDGKLNFDFFGHIESECTQLLLGERLEIFEGGCGKGYALGQLKGRFGNRIRTTGITLSERHIKYAAHYGGVDLLIVSPIEEYPFFDQQYDFIFDYCGASFYFPKEVIPIYAKILKPGKKAFLRLMGKTKQEHKKIFEQNGLEILNYAGSDEILNHEFVLRSYLLD